MIETKIQRGVKLYDSLDVFLTFQNFGSTWLGILRGPTDQIELAFNGLFNYKGANGELNFTDHLKTVAIFWTSEKNLDRYFCNRIDHANLQNAWPIFSPQAKSFAESQILALRDNGHETFLNFSKDVPECYSIGKTTAEKPDEDFRDLVVTHSLQDHHSDKKESTENLDIE